MKNLNAFFVIGTVGMIVTAILHMMLTVVISDASLQSAFFVIYPTFITFLVIGTRQMVREQKPAIENEQV